MQLHKKMISSEDGCVDLSFEDRNRCFFFLNMKLQNLPVVPAGVMMHNTRFYHNFFRLPKNVMNQTWMYKIPSVCPIYFMNV